MPSRCPREATPVRPVLGSHGGAAGGRVRLFGQRLHREFIDWTGEPALSEYYAGYPSSDDAPHVYALRHPFASLAALVALVRLPTKAALLSSAPERAAIHRRGATTATAGTS